ncbi:MAG: hypothetical protein K0R82_2703 [Flavipsychrobacter sp.]|jgi:phenylalanine-4-hydroxylase|nr:hypothetical protein [Flavipsychrobacter sp.]
MNVTTVELTLVKSTKGTHVYGSDLVDAATQSVYIQRSALPEQPPSTITLTLSWE